MYCSAAAAAAVGQNLTRAHLWAFVFVRLSEKRSRNIKKYEEGAGGEEQLGVAVVHMDFSLFLYSPLYCSHLPLSPSLSYSDSLSCALVFLALAGHAAAARLCGSLGFMVAALPLCNDGLVNSGVERHSLRQPTAASDT